MRDTSAGFWRRVPGFLLTAPGRCRLRRLLLKPVEPVLWPIGGLRRRLLDRSRTVVAVTGSFGKTTTARAIRAAVGLPVGPTAGPNASVSLALALITGSCRSHFSVFEVGIGKKQRGQLVPVARAMQPDVVVVTYIGSEHALSFPILENTRAEKLELLRGMAPGGVAVLNGDNPHVRWMGGQTSRQVLTFGFGDANDVRAESVEIDWPRGMRVTVSVGTWRETIPVRLLGEHVAGSVLAALAVAHATGIDLSSAAARLTELAPTPARMQIVALPAGGHLLRDEYKSGLDTVHRALDVFERIPARRRIMVFGDITFGEISEPLPLQHQHYVAVGERIAPSLDRAVLLGTKVDAYRAGLTRGGLAPDRIVDAGRSWRRALEALEGTIGSGDVVLLKGRHDERLDRIALALLGRQVGCDLVMCNTPLGRCDTCAMLERGWGTREPVI